MNNEYYNNKPKKTNKVTVIIIVLLIIGAFIILPKKDVSDENLKTQDQFLTEVVEKLNEGKMTTEELEVHIARGEVKKTDIIKLVEEGKIKKDPFSTTIDILVDIKSKKYIDVANAFISNLKTKINYSSDFNFYNTDTFYLVQVGDDRAKSCAPLERGGISPYGNNWEYAYVGVTFDGNNYTYYFMAQDSSKVGIELTTEANISLKGTQLIKTNTPDFKNIYNNEGSIVYNRENIPQELREAIKTAAKDYNRVSIINKPTCKE